MKMRAVQQSNRVRIRTTAQNNTLARCWQASQPTRTLQLGRRQLPSNRSNTGTTRASLVAGPPEYYNFRADTKALSQAIIEKFYPDLRDLVEDGSLVVYQRPEDYVERRTDGYREPELVILVGTAHVSQRSADAVERVIEAVQPENVVVELCRSRSAALYDPAGSRPSREHPTVDSVQDTVSDQSAASAAGMPEEETHQASNDGSSGRVASGSRASSQLPLAPATDRMNESSSTGNSSRNESIGSSSGSIGNSGRSPGMAGSGADRKDEAAVGPVMLSGGGFWEAAIRSVRLGGQSALVLQLLLALLYRNASGAMGFAPGGEFRAASRAAEKVGAQLVLGDRPIEITLARAWGALSPQQQWQLMKELLSAGLSRSAFKGLSEEKIQEMMTDDFLSTSFNVLGQQYPQLLSPLVHERDLYLAWSLKRSKAVNGTERVVGVVGRGHLRGVVYALTNGDGGLRFKDLVGGRGSKGRFAANVVQRVLGEVLLGLGLYVAWTTLVT